MNITDPRGYTPIHLAFESGDWAKIENAINEGADLTVVTPSRADLRDFAEGLNRLALFERLTKHLERRASDTR